MQRHPGADCGLDCDHVPVVAVMKVKIKKVKKRTKCKVRKEWRDLNGEKLRRKYLIDVKNRYEVLGEGVSEDEEKGVEREWKNLQKALVEIAENVLTREGNNHTATMDNTRQTQFEDKRRKWKLNTVKYRDLDKDIKK